MIKVSNLKATIALASMCIATSALAFNPLGDLNKSLQGLSDALKGVQQPPAEDNDKNKQPSQAPGQPPKPPGPAGFSIPALGGSQPGGGDVFSNGRTGKGDQSWPCWTTPAWL